MLDHQLVFASFRLDLANEQLREGEDLVPLRPKPFAVLRYLVEHPGRLVTHTELQHSVWSGTYVSESLLRGYVRELREVLGDEAASPRFIATIPRRGYRFLPAVTTLDQGLGTRDWELIPSALPAERPAPSPESHAPMLVGREQELAHLHAWLAKAAKGERQFVFITGEPGIGKTTLVDAFRQRRETRDWRQVPFPQALSLLPLISPVSFAHGQCAEHYGAGEAYLPVLEALGRLCRQPSGERLLAVLRRYAPTWLVQMPALINDSELEALQRKVQGATRERMLREMAEALEVLTQETLLVLVLEDLHWSDLSTMDLLGLLARRREPARLLIIGTYRPADVIVGRHPVKALKQELQGHGLCQELALGFLTESAVTEYLTGRFALTITSQPPLKKLASTIYQRTDGNPLFMVNVVDDWVSQGMLVEHEGQWTIAKQVNDVTIEIPEDLRRMIERQLARLAPEEQRLLEVASVFGVEFSTAAVVAGLEERQEVVEAQCERLSRREQFIRVQGVETLPDGSIGGRYEFLHALYQRTLYERLAETRRVRLHRRIGEREEAAYGAHASEHAAELAVHFERGQEYQRAVRYLQHAAENAARRSAHREAINLLNKGLALLQAFPDTPDRLQQELTLQTALGRSLIATKGYASPEVEHAYSRAHELCRQVGETPRLLQVLLGLETFHFVRAEFQTAREMAEQILQRAHHAPPPVVLSAYATLGATFLNLGELITARDYLERGLSPSHPQRHGSPILHDPGVVCLAYSAVTLWYLGYPDQALQKGREALRLALEFSPFLQAFTLFFAAWLRELRREGPAAREQAETLMTLAREQEFSYWTAQGAIIKGWALAEQGQGEAGIALMRQGLTAHHATGAELGRRRYLTLLAQAYGKIGHPVEGLTVLDQIFTTMDKEADNIDRAELYRLKGELLLQQSRAGLEQVQGKSKTSQTVKGKKP